MHITAGLLRPFVWTVFIVGGVLWGLMIVGPTRLVLPQIGPPRERSQSTIPIILQWTRFFHKFLVPDEGVKTCALLGGVQCYITHDRRYLRESDAIVIHARNLWLWDLPRWRAANQKWVFFNKESPVHTEISDYSALANIFNWTYTYRSDSDIFTPYGRLIAYPDNDNPQAVEKRWNAVKKKLSKSFASKTRDAAWVASHCKATSNRDDYVHELGNYMTVDSYGFCGTLECPLTDSNSQCMQRYEAKYRFYLSFENSICKDYITEKVFQPLTYDLIPVVMGGINLTGLVPPKSVIDASQFATPKELAKFLHRVGSDFRLYAEYFRWRSKFQIVTQAAENFCELCAALHKPNAIDTSTTYIDFDEWWVKKAECKTWQSTDKKYVPYEL